MTFKTRDLGNHWSFILIKCPKKLLLKQKVNT